jgi:peptidoglycan/LPS O-acetylase OafA/YrhL
MTSLLRARRTLGAATEAHDNGFNLVRLVCAMLVVFYHAWQMNTLRPGADPITAFVAPVGDLGGLAVGVFFVISGMFVTQSWMRDPHLPRYALRRIARILPGLFVCMLVTTVLAVAFFSVQGWTGLLERGPWRLVFSNTVLHWLKYIIPPEEQLLPGVLKGQYLNGPLWTLYWEGRMYVMVALIGLSAALPMRRWVRGCALFLLLAANLFPDVVSGYVWEVRMWSLFLVGMLLQTMARSVRIGPVQLLCAIALAALNWTRSAALTPSPLTWFGIALVAVTAALWVGSSRVRFIGHVQRNDYSYGVYIYHWPIILMLREVLPPIGALRLTAVALLVILPVAMLSWHFVEAPAQRLARRWLRRPATSAPSSTTVIPAQAGTHAERELG